MPTMTMLNPPKSQQVRWFSFSFLYYLNDLIDDTGSQHKVTSQENKVRGSSKLGDFMLCGPWASLRQSVQQVRGCLNQCGGPTVHTAFMVKTSRSRNRDPATHCQQFFIVTVESISKENSWQRGLWIFFFSEKQIIPVCLSRQLNELPTDARTAESLPIFCCGLEIISDDILTPRLLISKQTKRIQRAW